MSEWTFCRFGLIVTGRGEEEFLPRFLRALTTDGRCSFEVVRRVGQRSPRQAPALLKMVGSGKTIPNRDQDEIGLPARNYLRQPCRYVLVVDDLEAERSAALPAVYARYRAALDTMLKPVGLETRASVHFLVMMLEAYYFADAAAINAVLGLTLEDEPGDVEEKSHPKNELKALFKGFDEEEHGRLVVDRLDLAHVLSRRNTCASLRTLVKWCQKAKGVPFSEEFCLANGRLSDVTKAQLDLLPG